MTTQTDATPRADGFRHRTTLQVRFGDLDAFGHVNNAVFATYVEVARIRYLLDVLRPDGPFDSMPLILARLAIDFRSPIMFGETVEVATRVDHVGRSSFAMSHRMTAGPEARLVGDVATVLVAYDYAAARPMPVPDAWRRLLADFEGRSMDLPSAPDASRRVTAGTPT